MLDKIEKSEILKRLEINYCEDCPIAMDSGCDKRSLAETCKCPEIDTMEIIDAVYNLGLEHGEYNYKDKLINKIYDWMEEV